MLGPKLVVSASSFRLVSAHRLSLLKHLESKGYSVVVAAPEGEGRAELLRAGLATEVLPMDPTGKSPISDLMLWSRYRRLFRRERPAAFVGFTAKPNIYGSLAAQSVGIPTINTISGLGRVFVRQSPLRGLVEGLYRVAFRRASVVFFENYDDRDLFIRRRIVRPDQAVRTPGTGIDLNEFTPAQGSAASGNPFAFLFAARLLWDKGVQQYIDAARKVKARHPETEFRLLGYIEPRGRDAVPAERLERWDREGVIRYLGSTKDIRPFIGDADCVVLPSYYREGVPRILMEAAAMARPVITTDAPGCRDAVDDRVTGLLCEPRSAESLAAAMMGMLELSSGEREQMGNAARNKMNTEFREELVHRAYSDALGKLGLPTS